MRNKGQCRRSSYRTDKCPHQSKIVIVTMVLSIIITVSAVITGHEQETNQERPYLVVTRFRRREAYAAWVIHRFRHIYLVYNI